MKERKLSFRFRWGDADSKCQIDIRSEDEQAITLDEIIECLVSLVIEQSIQDGAPDALPEVTDQGDQQEVDSKVPKGPTFH